MGDPNRLLNGDADAEERTLLESLRADVPSDGERDGMWRAIAAHTAIVAGGSAVTSSATASIAPAVAASKALVIKIAIAVVVAAGGTAVWRVRLAKPIVKPPVVVAPAPRVEPVAPIIAKEVEPVAAPPPRPRVKPPDALQAESRALMQARAQLRAGELDAAARSLHDARKQFGHGALDQEREVLSIELLAAQGKQESADKRARRFLREHPESPHAESVQRFFSK